MSQPKYITLFAIPPKSWDTHYGTFGRCIVGYEVRKRTHHCYPNKILHPPERFHTDRRRHIPRDWSSGERKAWIDEEIESFIGAFPDDWKNIIICDDCEMLSTCYEHSK